MARRKRNEYHDRLASVPLFSGLENDELDVIAGLGTEVPVALGIELTTEGGIAHEAFLVMTGSASCVKDGTEVATFGPGDFFGEMALISQQPRNATVVATTDMTVRAFDEGEFRRMLVDSPNVAVKILLSTAERLLSAQPSPTH
jgi:CRP-like cAMP-binding protein